MPVKDQPVGPLLTRLGIIRLGYKEPVTKNGKPVLDKHGKQVMRPVATDYFVLDDTPELINLLGQERPTQLNVLWPFNDVDRNVDDMYRIYGAGSIKCRGDGETMDICLKGADFVVTGGVCTKAFSENDETFDPGDIVRCAGPGEAALYPKCAGCSIVSYPKVLIKEAMEAGFFGYYQIGSGSTSKHGRANIRGTLEATREFVRFLTGRPHLAGIPMILSLQLDKISTPRKDRDTGREYRVRMDKPILHLVPHPDWVKVQTGVLLDQAYQPLARLPSPPEQLPPPPTQDATQHDVVEPIPEQARPPDHDKDLFEEGAFHDADDPARDNLDLSGIETHGQCWDSVFKEFNLYKSQAVKLAGLTDEQLATLHPGDIYAKVCNAAQAQLSQPQDDPQPADPPPNAEPADPATVKKELQDAAERRPNSIATAGQTGLINKFLNDVLGDDKARRSVLFWLWGKESSKDLTDREMLAMWDRLKITKEDDVWVADPAVLLEFQAIHRQALIDAGQLELDLDEPIPDDIF